MSLKYYPKKTIGYFDVQALINWCLSVLRQISAVSGCWLQVGLW